MVLRIERRGDELVIPVSAETAAAMGLKEGDEVDLSLAHSGNERAEHRYATIEEALDAYRKTEPQHRETYRELAK